MEKGCITIPQNIFELYLAGLEVEQALLLRSWLKSRKQVNCQYHLGKKDLRELYNCFDIDFNHLVSGEKPDVVEGHELISEIAPMYMQKLLPGYYAKTKWLKKWSRKPLTN